MKYQHYIAEYILEKREFGYGFVSEERFLKRFAEFADSRKIDFLQKNHFLEWKNNYGHANDTTWKRRLSVYRGFTNWLSYIDSRTETPPADLISTRGSNRKKPYIYTPKQVDDILAETMNLRSHLGLRRLTYYTLFAIYAVTGLRINEAINLCISDVNLKDNFLLIRNSKSKKERLVPFKKSTSRVLAKYHERTLFLTTKKRPDFFVIENDRPVTEFTTRYAFAQVSQNIGLRKKEKFGRHGKGPRIHDFRHTLAVNTIKRALENNLDVDEEIHKLSIYLGHETLKGTYWYIEAIPELLQLASEKAKNITLPSK